MSDAEGFDRNSESQPNGESRGNPKKRLSDILADGTDRDRLRRQWSEAKAAVDFGKPLPGGEYVARIAGGELFNSKTSQTPGYKLTFEVLEGGHVGRKLWHEIWLSEAAIAMAKLTLGKLGVTSIDQLDQPLPPGIRCRVKVAVRKGDDGTERNRITTFEVIGVDTPELDPFAPALMNDAAGNVPPSAPPTASSNASSNASPDGNDNQAGERGEV